MSAPPTSSGAPLTDRRQLVEYIAAGAKPPDQWRIGTEHEKFAFRLDNLRPLPYEGEAASIRNLLEGLATRFGWTRVEENGKPIALRRGDCNITLEPGGQVELSGAPLKTLHQTCDETNQHLDEVRAVASDLGVGFLGNGFNPKWPRDAIPWMPKARYKIMRDYMPKKGKLGLDMMLRTCTVQVNLDYESEADMVRKFRVSMALQPLTTALFANSPFMEGKPSSFLSTRGHMWTDTDNERSGLLKFVFEPGMSYERYVDWMLDVPMYFAYRDGNYIDLQGRSFRDFMAGKFKDIVKDEPRITDFTDHLTTAFPDVRLKRYLEMRGADAGRWRLCALPALWVGLLYDSVALDAAAELIKDWTFEEIQAMRRDVPRLALKTPFRRGTLHSIAKQVVTIARAGLTRRDRRDRAGDQNEAHFLDPITEAAETGITSAEEKLALFHGRWQGSVDHLFQENAY
jgi:glutamate--cysteine ligase